MSIIIHSIKFFILFIRSLTIGGIIFSTYFLFNLTN